MRPLGLRELLSIEVHVLPLVDLGGGRRFVPFEGGTFAGHDGLGGVLCEGGVDWQSVRPDGTLEIDAHYTLSTDADELIEVRSQGLRKATPEVTERLMRGEVGDDLDTALARYEAVRRPATAAVVEANRGLGPELPMLMVERRAPEGFADISSVITPEEIAEVTEDYRRTAGFSLAALVEGASLLDQPFGE